MITPTPDEICERLRALVAELETWDEALLAELRETTPAKRLVEMLSEHSLIQQQQATIERLSAALAFYADERNWRSVTVYMCGHGAINCNVMADKGGKARTALGKDASDE